MTEVKRKLEPVKRWVPSKKLWLIDCLQNGVVTREEAMAFYGLSDEELRDWERKIHRFGARGLRTTRTQDYRVT